MMGCKIWFSGIVKICGNIDRFRVVRLFKMLDEINSCFFVWVWGRYWYIIN